ncbi:MAG: orotidine-5'-phosphate decarboxylase [Spirochaetaceae bacterium]|nr:MAG: orotidine-5'-phosphate decarboxylase [Spirochaetaceae bacterium]
MNYRTKLTHSAAEAGSLFCLGIDPILELFPAELRPTGTVLDVSGIDSLVQTALDALEERALRPAAFKPNIGYFSACDRPLQVELSAAQRFSGSMALAKVMHTVRTRMPGVPVILDSKRGDIARSSRNYAVEAFSCWAADAVTVSPWMGDDSVRPFMEAAPEGGVYILARTSNPGAERFQNRPAPQQPLYRHVVQLVRDLSPAYPGTGIVVGATAPAELADVAVALHKAAVPILVPGAGYQGGTAADVMAVLRDARYPMELVRINISSGTLFPWLQDGKAPPDWRRAVQDAVIDAYESTRIAPHRRRPHR